ncbi:hypothetical protein SK128_014895 [Halocaridina rubra]|uniref:Uncharacterized protein n=1 Tax=Halocaridina rubra TaxID=373956 RepID=A0AAN8X2L9_HALRR
MVFAGDTIHLECLFNLQEHDRLYSVAWWRDQKHFYEFMPTAEMGKNKAKYDTVGIDVDPNNITPSLAVYLYLTLNQFHTSFGLAIVQETLNHRDKVAKSFLSHLTDFLGNVVHSWVLFICSPTKTPSLTIA